MYSPHSISISRRNVNVIVNFCTFLPFNFRLHTYFPSRENNIFLNFHISVDKFMYFFQKKITSPSTLSVLLSNICIYLPSLECISFKRKPYFYQLCLYFCQISVFLSTETDISTNLVSISVKYLYFPSISGVSAYWPSLRAQTPNELKLPQRTPYKSSNQKRICYNVVESFQRG